MDERRKKESRQGRSSKIKKRKEEGILEQRKGNRWEMRGRNNAGKTGRRGKKKGNKGNRKTGRN